MSERITFTEELTNLGHMNILTGASSREAYIEEMADIFASDPSKYMFVSAEGASYSGKLVELKGKYPQCFVELGIAEQNAVGAAAGLALCGKTVFLNGFGPFLALRTLDQVHTDIAYQNVPVRLINTHAGVTSGGGPTHYNIMDIAIMRVMPNMTCIVPSDADQCKKAIRATESIPGPVNIRVTRGKEPQVYTNTNYKFEVGKAIEAVPGNDATVIACGSTVALAVSAANGLEKEGIHVRVLDMHTIQPLDEEAIIKAAKETGVIITVEDHLDIGGLNGAVSEVLAKSGLGIKYKALGLPRNEGFPHLGDMWELYDHYGFGPEGIKKTVREMLR